MGRRRLATRARSAIEAGGGVAERFAELIVEAAEVIAERSVEAIRSERDRWPGRPDRGVFHGLAEEPLASLYEVHPEARTALARPLGLRSIPTDEIAGTAVGGAAQRGADFLPLRRFRGTNWEGRWQRIQGAVDRMAVLPPIDVMKYADRYWVIDGHNRVAAARLAGQVEMDADVTELRPPGTTGEPAGSLASSLASSWTAGATGEGRWAPPPSEPPPSSEPGPERPGPAL